MSPPTPPTRPRHKAKLSAAHLLLLLAAMIAIHVAVVVHRRASHPGDFDISREFGRRLLAHEELYAGGLHYPYLPAAALFFAPLALLEPSLAFALRYALGLASLALTLRLLLRMLRPHCAELDKQQLAVTVATLILAGHYIIRDLDDGGPHLFLLALVTTGLAAATTGRNFTAGLCIGLAAAVKAPHALLIGFFLWSRQTRLAAWAAVATVAWMLAPLPWMGIESWYGHHVQWARTAAASVVIDPTPGAAESEGRIQNQALPATVARWSRRWQNSEDAGRQDAGHWPARLAGLSLLLAVVWLTRAADPRSPHWLKHTSLVLITTLLLSPATWTQHLVLLIPALYLVVAWRQTSAHSAARPLTAGLIVFGIVALLLNRELLGRTIYFTLLDYGLHTFAMLLLLILVLVAGHRRVYSDWSRAAPNAVPPMIDDWRSPR